MTPEARARQTIDALLTAAGWHVCNVADANIHAARGVAIREFPLNSGFGFADYLLYIDGKATGVIEAKKEGATLRRPHASIPRSPRIAEPLFLARYIEKAGTGTLDMISQCAQAGLPAPEFRQDGGQFIQTLWRPKVTEGVDGTKPLGTQSGTKSAPSRNPRQSQHWRGFDRFDGGGQTQ